MEEKIQYLLTEKQCVYMEVNLKNNDTYNIYMPNQDKGNTVAIDNGILQWTQESNDGCIYERYIKVDEISFVTGIYNCPQLIRSEDNA